MATRLDILPKPVANIEAPAAAIGISETRQDITPKLAQLVTGQLLKGEILSKLMDGSFTVRVAGITAKMMLPEGSKTGDQIPLRLIATEPRPTFLLEHDGDAHFPAPLPQNYAAGTDRRQSPSLSTYLGSVSEEIATPSQTMPGSARLLVEGNKQANASSIVNLSTQDPSQPNTDEVGLSPGKAGAQQIATARPAEITAKNNLANTNAADTLLDPLSSTPTSLSNTGRLITQILQAAPAQADKTNIASPTPIVAASVELKDTASTAIKLQQQISTSGLFYESHVAEWAQGKRPIADIKAEPQSQIGASSQTDSSSGIQSTTLTTINKEMGQIIHQQLNVLEQNIVRWQGELFPGQKIEWEIKKETQSKHNPQEMEDATSWQSVVRFDLPNLGLVTAIINLQSNNLGLSLRAEQSNTVSALKDHASELAAAMQVAGSPLMSFAVNKNERS
ncbi:flagellar hook-length control protein FliK [Undibacterium pigrum]|uniref:Flagellar hook-length control protein FliK n=1 Tax=Undibacterium pigrum TaxID=401470 RepID=A0A318K0D8_9BURK|nr:flagellar hook-length control protein FliK [Undibacterium pigrum]PXX46744.1 flagellar hook-length control protein FliK [Undibacterium pigrum]